jgi:hypothetical protein
MTGVSRGQLITVGGLLLAVLLIGIALVLNSVIFAENVETQSGPDAGAPEEVRADTNTTAWTAIHDINVRNSDNRSYAHLEAELDDWMADWVGMVRKERAITGEWIRLNRTGVTHGWRVLQTNNERNFTAGGTAGMAGQQTWLVAENVQQTGGFEQNLSRQSLYGAGYGTTEAALANSSYHIAIDEPGTSGFWRVYVFQGVGTQNVYVLTEEPDENFVGNTAAYVNFAAGSCAYQTITWVELDLRAGTFGGAPCDELAFYSDLEPGYDIYYNATAGTDSLGNHVNRSKGTYELFVGTAEVDDAPYYRASSGDSPFRLTALYGADYDLGYESQQVTSLGEIRPRPPRPDPDGVAPTVSFSLTYEAGTLTDAYQVDWSVSDPEGDLSSVEVLLYENATSTRIDSENVSVSGDSASGVTTLGPTSDGVRYDVYVIATDDRGVTTVRKESDVAN